jgi:hypothetical protein
VKQHKGRNRRHNITMVLICRSPLHLLECIVDALLEITLACILSFALARKWTRVGSSLTSLGLAEQQQSRQDESKSKSTPHTCSQISEPSLVGALALLLPAKT